MSERPLKIYSILDAKTDVAISGNLNLHTTSSFNATSIVTSSDGMIDVQVTLHNLDQAIVDKGIEVKNSYEGARYKLVSNLDAQGHALINLTTAASMGSNYFTTGNLQDVKLDILINTLNDGHYRNDMASAQLYVSGASLFAEIDALGAPNAQYRLIATNETQLLLTGAASGSGGLSGGGGGTYSLVTTSSDGLMSSADKIKIDYFTISSNNLSIPGNLTVAGTLTAQEYHTEFVSSSVIYESGSTKFGNDSADFHQFSGSVYVSGNVEVTGALNTNVRNTWAKPQVASITSLTASAGNIGIDLSSTNNFSFACAATTTAYTLLAPSNPAAGQSGIIVVTQGGSSASTLAFNSFWKFPTGMDKALSTTLNSVNAIAYYLPTSGYAICSFLKEIA